VRVDRTVLVAALVSQFAATVAFAATVGLGERGWIVGISFAVTANVLLARGLARHGADRLGPADRVTLLRATLAGGVAALVADSSGRLTPVTTLVGLTVVALVLDAVDGWVARRTRTVSALGARFDGEVDAVLILVLSVYVARSAGGWVLAIGTARYAFLAAGWLMPWLRGQLPPRYWRKVVAASQGIVLTIAAAGVLPRAAMAAALLAALGLLAESFGRDVWWLSRRRRVLPRPVAGPPAFVAAPS
jgi:phosphatidylglycerophosphate synthase